MSTQPVILKQDDEQPIGSEILAKAIIEIDAAMKRIVAAGLRRETIVLLIHDHCHVGKPDIRKVLLSLEQLKHTYTTK